MKKYLLISLFFFCSYSLSAQYYQNGIVSPRNNSNPHALFQGDCDTIFSFSTLCNTPSGLTFDGNYLYTIASYLDTIYKFNITGQFVGSIPFPGDLLSGGDMDFDGEYLWVVSEQDGYVYKINPANGYIIASFKLPGESEDPNYYGCAYDNGFLWITEYIDENLLRIDATTGEIIDSFNIGRMVLPLAIIHDELYGIEFIYEVQDLSMQLIKFDKSNGSIKDSSSWCIPYSLGLCRTENNTWGLSGGLNIGYKRIYEFDSLFTSNHSDFTSLISHNVFPNPFISATKIDYYLNHSETVTLTFYNQFGKQVDVMEQQQSAGKQQMIWTPDLPGGVYYFRLHAGEQTASGKIVLMR